MLRGLQHWVFVGISGRFNYSGEWFCTSSLHHLPLLLLHWSGYGGLDMDLCGPTSFLIGAIGCVEAGPLLPDFLGIFLHPEYQNIQNSKNKN